MLFKNNRSVSHKSKPSSDLPLNIVDMVPCQVDCIPYADEHKALLNLKMPVLLQKHLGTVILHFYNGEMF